MRVALGSDHAGVDLKSHLLSVVAAQGHETLDVGTQGAEAVDYPDYAEKVGLAVLEGRAEGGGASAGQSAGESDGATAAERGIMICGSGVGACVAINKLPGIRAGVCHDTYSAHQGVEHDDMNVLVLGGRIVGSALAEELVAAFLGARFSGEQRHQRRLDKVRALEERYGYGWRPR